MQLVFAESGLHVWSERFDESLNDLPDGQQRVVARMLSGPRTNMMEIESKRSQRERLTSPDAFDLILQARTLRNLPRTPQRRAEALAVSERALLLDPGASLAMATTALLLLQHRTESWCWMDFETMTRANALASQALTIAPTSQAAVMARLVLLRAQERMKEAAIAAQQYIMMFPNDATGYSVLAFTSGEAEQGMALTGKAIQIDPLGPNVYGLYRDLGYASLMLGRDRDAIGFFERSLALNPDVSAFARQSVLRQMAAAFAQLGEDGQA